MTFDHGYAVSSPPIKALVQVLCAYGPEEQKAFLRFVTGAPRLPPGGLAALHPRLTVVCKQPSGAAGGSTRADGQPISSGTPLADKDLPSAMTCASYLKLPPYSCMEVLRGGGGGISGLFSDEIYAIHAQAEFISSFLALIFVPNTVQQSCYRECSSGVRGLRMQPGLTVP